MPKIALPTRTCVAPAAMAVSKSPDMPIERTFSPCTSAIAPDAGNRAPGPALRAGCTSALPCLRRNRARMARIKASASVRATPDFCGSSPIFTCTSNSGSRPAFCAAASMASARVFAVQAVDAVRPGARPAPPYWSAAPPMMCSRAPASGNFCAASCTRFSPKHCLPGGKCGRTCERGWVLLTATRRDAGRVAPGGQAAARYPGQNGFQVCGDRARVSHGCRVTGLGAQGKARRGREQNPPLMVFYGCRPPARPAAVDPAAAERPMRRGVPA